jgi:hypothetical protein
MSDVMERLRKLIRHEESAREIGSLAEAGAFAEKIAALLIEHKLEMSQVTAGDDHDEETREIVEEQRFDPLALGIPYNGRQRVAWLEHLASGVARANFCRIVVTPRSTTFYFVGKATDRTIAGNTFAALVRGDIAAYDTEYAKARKDPWTDVSGFRRSFYDGFARAVAGRLYAQRRAVDATAESTALVLASADKAVALYMDAKYRGPGSKASSIGGTSKHNDTAYEKGRAAGQRASINTPLGSGGVRGALKS